MSQLLSFVTFIFVFSSMFLNPTNLSSIQENSNSTTNRKSNIALEKEKKEEIVKPKQFDNFLNAPNAMDVFNFDKNIVDSKAQNVPSRLQSNVFSNPQKYLPQLVDYLGEGSQNTLHKAKRFHDWIALNIGYDTRAYFSGKYPEQDYATVIRRRQGVCSGNANVFKQMCDLGGIKSEKVQGYSRGYGFNIFEKEEFGEQIRHVWNAIEYRGYWYLLDITWDAGYVENQRFVRQYSTAYLFPRPEKMVYTHFPKDSKWQLLPVVLSASKFKCQPQVLKNYFKYDVEFISEIEKINKTDFSHNIQLTTPQNVAVTAIVIGPNGREFPQQAFAQREPQNGRAKWSIDLVFPKVGKWTCRLYAKELYEEDYHSFSEIGYFNNKAAKFEFPMKYKQFDEIQAYLYGPINEVKQGTTEKFKLKLPGIVEASLVVDQEWHQLTHVGDDVFETSFSIPRAKEIILFVKSNPNARNSQAVLNWQIER